MFRECETYFSSLTDDEELALLLNPVTCHVGVKVLTMWGMLSDEKISEIKDKLVERIMKYFRKVGTNSNNIVQEPSTEGGSPAECDDGARSMNNTTAEGLDDTDDEDAFLNAMHELVAGGSSNGMAGDSKAEILMEYEKFVRSIASLTAQEWGNLVMKFPSKFMRDEIESEMRSLKMEAHKAAIAQGYCWRTMKTDWKLIPVNPIYTNKRLDILACWRDISMLYPNIFPTACIILGKPPTNAKQERLFSWATWFDGNLRQRLSESGFEMRLLEKANRDFVREERRLRDTGDDSLCTVDATSPSWRKIVENVLEAQKSVSAQALSEGDAIQTIVVDELAEGNPSSNEIVVMEVASDDGLDVLDEECETGDSERNDSCDESDDDNSLEDGCIAGFMKKRKSDVDLCLRALKRYTSSHDNLEKFDSGGNRVANESHSELYNTDANH